MLPVCFFKCISLFIINQFSDKTIPQTNTLAGQSHPLLLINCWSWHCILLLQRELVWTAPWCHVATVGRVCVSAVTDLHCKTRSSTRPICFFEHPICLKGTGSNLLLSVLWLLLREEIYLLLHLRCYLRSLIYSAINPWSLCSVLLDKTSFLFFLLLQLVALSLDLNPDIIKK